MTYAERQAFAAFLFFLALGASIYGLFVGHWIAMVVMVLFVLAGSVEEGQ